MSKQCNIMGVPMTKPEYQMIRKFIVKEQQNGMHPGTQEVKNYLTIYKHPEETETFHGFPVSPSERQQLTFVVTNEEQQGWHPTKKDIRHLIQSGRHPSKHLRDKMKNFDRDIEEANRRG